MENEDTGVDVCRGKPLQTSAQELFCLDSLPSIWQAKGVRIEHKMLFYEQ